MKIAVDKNQLQKGSHAQSNAYNHRMMERAGHELIAIPLPYADYAEVTAEMQETIDRRGDKLKKADLVGDIKIAVDRKNSIDEICGNVCSTTKAHERFRDEVILAQKCGCKFYVLIEDDKVTSLDDLEKWQNPREKKYFYYKALMAQGKKLRMILPKQPPASGKKLAKALRTMETKYGVKFLFCKPKDAAARIVEILSNDK